MWHVSWHISCVMCQISRVRCHMSCVTCHMSCVTCHLFFFPDKVVKLISGGSVINGAYHVYLLEIFINMAGKKCPGVVCSKIRTLSSGLGQRVTGFLPVLMQPEGGLWPLNHFLYPPVVTKGLYFAIFFGQARRRAGLHKAFQLSSVRSYVSNSFRCVLHCQYTSDHQYFFYRLQTPYKITIRGADERCPYKGPKYIFGGYY